MASVGQLDLGPIVRQFLGPQGKPETLIKRISIRSAYGPDIDLVDPFQGPSVVAPLMRRLKPRVTIEVQGLGPLDFAPYGQPPPTAWPTIQAGAIAGGVVVGALTLLGLYKVLSKKG